MGHDWDPPHPSENFEQEPFNFVTPLQKIL